MEACKLISSIPVWMGYAAKIKNRVISLQEANDMIVGLKRLDKEDLKRPIWNSIMTLLMEAQKYREQPLCYGSTICPISYLL